MGLRDILPFLNSPQGQPSNAAVSGDALLGYTAPYPDPEDLPRPRAGLVPIGQSGRANFYGLPQPDELNRELIGLEGLRRFNEMYRSDAHVRRLILAAWSPLAAGTWTLEPYGGDDATDQDRQIAQDIWWLLTQWMTPNFYEHLYEIGPLLLRSGFLACEQIWDTVAHDGKTLLAPRSLQVRLPVSIWRWWQDQFGQLTHIGQILPNRADVVIPATEILYYRLGAEGDNWMGTSMLRHCYKHWYLKDRLERIDAIGQERKAVGVPVVYPPKGADSTVKAQLEQLLMSMHMSEVAYLMMPGPKAGSQGANAIPQEEWLLDVIKFDSSSGEGIMNSIAYHQTAIAASFLTDFLELGHHQVGARATAEVQEDPFLTAINGALLPPVIPPLNRLVDRIRRINWEGAAGSPQLKLTLNDEASLSEIAAYVVPLVQAGVMQTDPELEDWVRDRAGMPAANSEIREQKLAAQEAGFESAQQMASTGETPGEEPPSPNADPARPQGPSGGPQSGAPSGGAQAGGPKNGGNPIAGAVKSTGKPKQLDQDSRPTVCVDFDGVIHPKGENDATVLTAAPVPGASAGLMRLAKTYRVVICTARTDLAPVRAYLTAHAMGQFASTVTNVKPPAVAYVDDRAVPFNSWAGVEQQVAKQLDGAVSGSMPLGGGLGSAAGLQMVPETGGDPEDDEDEDDGHRPHAKKLDAPASPVAAGVIVHAADTGRLLAVKRAPDDSDAPDVFASWEFPGGKLDPEDSEAFAGACREMAEECGATLPDTAKRLGHVDSPDGVYRAFLVQVPQETDVKVGHDQRGEVADTDWHHPSEFDRPPASPRVTALMPNVHRILAGKQLDAAAEPTAKWFEQLLSKDRLQQAFDGARDHIQAACQPATLLAARQIANQAANGKDVSNMTAPPELVDALHKHYAGLYALGHQTVIDELATQRAKLKRTLDAPVADAAVSGARLIRAQQRAEHSARNIVRAVVEKVGRGQVSALKDGLALTADAEQAATAQLRQEALSNTAVSVNDGRADAAQASPDVVGAYYTSCMDARSCDPCVQADDGVLLSTDQALALGPPNPDCQGGDYCRCALVWVLSDDPAAIGAAG